jgi:hypothetical protein
MATQYMGPDGELFDSEGPGRTRMTKLSCLTEEFAHFREGWFQAKMNDFTEKGARCQSQDDIDIIRMYSDRRRVIGGNPL